VLNVSHVRWRNSRQGLSNPCARSFYFQSGDYKEHLPRLSQVSVAHSATDLSSLWYIAPTTRSLSLWRWVLTLRTTIKIALGGLVSPFRQITAASRNRGADKTAARSQTATRKSVLLLEGFQPSAHSSNEGLHGYIDNVESVKSQGEGLRTPRVQAGRCCTPHERELRGWP